MLSLVTTLQLFAQIEKLDSAKLKTKIAIADARHFNQTKEIRLARRKRHLLNTSDYFRPTAMTVSKPKLLTDSVYVSAYKNAAYNKCIHRSGFSNFHYVPDLSAGHIVSVVVVTAVIIVGVIAFANLLSKIDTK